LLNLFSLRSQKIKPYIEENKFPNLKASGANLREYSDYEEHIDFENALFKSVQNPIEEEWLNFIFDETIFKFSHIENLFEEYRISENDLKQAIVLWLNGKWYDEIAVLFDNDIDKALNIVNRVIMFDVQNTLSQVINLVEISFIKDEIEISPQILKFPQFVNYGTYKECVLDLIEIGFNERVANEKLGEIIEKRFNYSDIRDLKMYLIENESDIMDLIENVIPVLSYETLKKNFEYLNYYR
ncbi:MAG: hypothetical protein GY797_20185, partial [Deltaproteobacteria bacterium]|nr:hypothetical protein [Deltaproteobacteria bacterium]